MVYGESSLGSETETQNRSWFYFSIANLEKGVTLRLRVVNLNVQAKLFAGGYTPVWRCPPHRPTWEGTKKGCTFGKGPFGFWIEWLFTLPSDLPALGGATPIFFAFAVPYSTADVEKKLRSVSEAIESSPELKQSVYYHRSTLVKSCDGRAVPLLTLTSTKGRLEDELDGKAVIAEQDARDDGHKLLYPDNDTRNGRAGGRACSFARSKPIIFISARVHPAETMAQWMFDGILDFLLRPDDPRAAALRDRFVFKLVPLVNPDGEQEGSVGLLYGRFSPGNVDLRPTATFHTACCLLWCAGVARGHQRTDTWGQNLNRCYMTPTPTREPTVYAIREALLDWHKTGRLAMYFDLHAHTSRENAFLFGNFYPDLSDQVDNILLAKLATLNSQHVDFSNCNFSASGMSATMHDGTSKSGSGRVALFHATAASASRTSQEAGQERTKKAPNTRVLCYTIECHFNKGRHRNPCAYHSFRTPLAVIFASMPTIHGFLVSSCSWNCRIAKATGKGSERASPPRSATSSGGRYTTEDWAHIGRSTMVSVLDFYDCNPWSRLPKSEFRSLEGVRSWALQYVLQSKGFREDPKIQEQGEREQFLGIGKAKLKGSRLAGSKSKQRRPKR